MNPFLFRRIRGPVFLLCFALTALLWQAHVLSFGRSWPFYLITAGLLRLGDAVFSRRALRAGWYAQGGPAFGAAGPRSFGGGVFVLLLGVVALLVTTGILPRVEVWEGFGRWWPLLLVLLGLLLLGERLLENRISRVPGQVPYRRRGGSGLVWLVILLVLLGLASSSRHFYGWGGWPHGNAKFGPFDQDFSFGGETHENDVSQDHGFVADGTLTVDNARGDVRIAPSQDGRIHVDAHQVARVPDGEKSRAFAETHPRLTVNGSSATLTVPGRPNVEVRLVLAVPDGTRCMVRTHHGDVAVSGLRLGLTLNQDHGDVSLEGLGGPVTVTMDHGDLRARSLGSDLTVQGRADDVSVSGIAGKTEMRGEFFGDTTVEKAEGPVSFHSDRTQFDIGRLTGSLSLDSDDLRLTGVERGLTLNTRSKDVEIDGLSGEATVADSNGDIAVTAQQPLGTISLANTTGNVSLTLPVGASFRLRGETGRGGEISSELPLAQVREESGKTIAGEVGQGGPLIELRTDHGDLTLKHGSAEAVRAPERLPEPVRRLRAPQPPAAPTVQ